MHECATRCPQPATHNVTVSTPDKLAQVNVDLCDEHYQAASNDRRNAKQDLKVEHEFRDERLGGDQERIRRLEPVITSAEFIWQSVDLVDRTQEPRATTHPEGTDKTSSNSADDRLAEVRSPIHQ